MRRQRGLVGLMGLAALGGVVLFATSASAGVTTEQSASILVFPKVVADGTRDTIIQITNTSNNVRFAHCFYVNGQLTRGRWADVPLPLSRTNPPLCIETDFDIILTRQQPTHWRVSTGRKIAVENSCRGPAPGVRTPCDPATAGNPTIGNLAPAHCCDAGFDPGAIPPVAPDFIGELKCIEVDETGAPVSGNALKGEATIVDLAPTGPTQVSKYNAIGIKGNDNNDGNGTLCLGGAGNDICPPQEYNGCPLVWMLDHPSEGAPVRLGTASTNLTVVPCSENFETQAWPPTTLQFAITNEFEQTFSASTTIGCFASLRLTDINPVFGWQAVAGNILQTRMRSAAGTPRGVLAVIEETHGTAVAAQNPHTSFQDQPGPDVIIVPGDQIGPPQ